MLIESYNLKSGSFTQIGTDVNKFAILKYKGPEIIYNLNSQGYRAKEWIEYDWNNSILVFGASNIFGVGVREEDTVSGHIENITGIPCINLGQIGSGCSAQWINSLRLLDQNIQPKGVVYVWPDESRDTEFKDDSGVRVDFVGNWTRRPFGRALAYHEFQGKILSNYYSDAINMLWTCPIAEFRLKTNDPASPLVEVDISRDSLHPGPESYKIWANLAIEKLAL